MPLPISHCLVGAGIATIIFPPAVLKRKWKIPLIGAALAIFPDFDFLLVWLTNENWAWHRGFSHSICFALLAIVIAAGATTLRLRSAVAAIAALISHGILDFLTTKDGAGVELFFPFTGERFKLGLVGISEFHDGFYAVEMIKTGIIEFCIFAPFLAFILWFRGYFNAFDNSEYSRN